MKEETRTIMTARYVGEDASVFEVGNINRAVMLAEMLLETPSENTGEEREIAFTWIPSENTIGIAEWNRRGYHETFAFSLENKKLDTVVDWLNENILGLTKRRAMQIGIRSMSKGLPK